MRSLDLTDLLHPTSIQDFLASVWERKPLFAPGRAERFCSLFDPEEVESAIRSAPDIGDARGAYCVRSDRSGTSEFPIHDEIAGRRSSTAALQGLHQGYTVVVSHVAHFHAKVSQLCSAVESKLQHPVGCNLYLTPSKARGFDPHFDLHDTFFMQIHGSKRWSLWRPTETLPDHYSELTNAAMPQGPPDLNITLTDGDVLYLPRGWIHTGVATDEMSLHLTLGVTTTSWADLLVEQVRTWARSNVQLRGSLPLAPDLDPNCRDISGSFLEMMDRFLHQPDTGTMAEEALQSLLVRRVEHHLPDLSPRLRRIAETDSWSLSTVVERRPGLAPAVEVTAVGTCRIVFLGSHVVGPREAEEAFRFIANHCQFEVSQLPALPDSAQLDLVKQLAVEGLLNVVRL